MPLPIAVGLLVVAQFLDYATFVAMIERHGLDAELNPLVVALFEQLGLIGVTVAKAATVTWSGAVVAILMRQRRAISSLIVGFGVGTGLIGAFSNVLTI